jgi:glycosyltransferase involved in cell wall biosynthesis
MAMSSGMEVVVSDTDALRSTAGDYPVHFVVRAVDIARVLRKLIQEKTANVGKQYLEEAACRVRQRFDIARFDREIVQIIQGVVG